VKPLRVDTFQQQQEWLCSRWAESLRKEVQSVRARMARYESDPGESAKRMRLYHLPRWSEELVKIESEYDLIRRGLDSRRPRRFRGRVQLEVRCKPRGHDLASVYPTAHRSVLVPAIRQLPLSEKNRRKDVRAERSRRPRQVLFTPTEPRGTDPYSGIVATIDPRDPWIESYLDEDVPEGFEPEERFSIRGMSVLLPDFETWVDHYMWITTPDRRVANSDVPADYPDRAAYELLCRCGTRWLRVQTLYEALANGRTRLAV